MVEIRKLPDDTWSHNMFKCIPAKRKWWEIRNKHSRMNPIHTAFKRIPMLPFWSLGFFPLIYFSLKSHCFTQPPLFWVECNSWQCIECTISRKKLFNFCFVGIRLETLNLLSGKSHAILVELFHTWNYEFLLKFNEKKTLTNEMNKWKI